MKWTLLDETQIDADSTRIPADDLSSSRAEHGDPEISQIHADETRKDADNLACGQAQNDADSTRINAEKTVCHPELDSGSSASAPNSWIPGQARNDNEPSVFANEVKQSSENADNDLGVKPLSKEPARISLLSHFSFAFLIIAIVAGALAGAGWYFRDEVKAGFARFNTPVTALRKYTIRTLDDPANTVGIYTSLAIGRDGYPVISYFDQTALSLKLYKCNNVACSAGTASTLDDPANQVGQYTSLAIGRDGYPVISFFDNTAKSLKLYKCNDVACTNGTASTLDDPANWVGYYTSLAIGRDDYPVISYYDGNAKSLKLYKCNDTACSSGTVSTLDDPANQVGTFSSLTVGSDGYPVISYYDDTAMSLKLYKCNDTACSSGTASTLDDPVNNVGQYISIAVGNDGYPVISYHDATALSLKLYKCNDVECSSGTASTLDDPANQVGYNTSLAIGRDGYPVISYYDATAGALKLYKCSDSTCSSGTALTLDDPANIVGQHTSLAIGRDGYPVISYKDLTAQSLKFAYLGAKVTQNVSPNTVVDDGLVGHWTFDGKDFVGTSTILDRSSSHATGTLVNMDQKSSRVMGKHGQGMLFSGGTTAAVNVPTVTTLNNLQSMTVSAWVKYSSPGGGMVLEKAVSRNGGWLWNISGGIMQFNIACFSGDVFVTTAANAAPNDGQWHQVIFTWDGSMDYTTIHGYVDGQEVSLSGTNCTLTPRDDDSASPLEIGRSDNSGGSTFRGAIDDVRIYNRILSADEIAELYGVGAGTKQGICGEGGVRDADGNVYGIVQIGNQCWLDRNMSVGNHIPTGTDQTNNATIEKWCSANLGASCTSNHPKRPDGGLYMWDEAMQYSTTAGAQGICPTGWHIPTDSEWYTLENYLKDSGQGCNPSRTNSWECSTAGTKLLSGGASLFEANLAGNAVFGYSYNLNTTGYFWSSSENGSAGWYRGFTNASSVGRDSAVKAYGFSVRCIRD